jgi:hypothetical protein
MHLTAECERFVGAIHKTKSIKEELMMKVWHPARVEKFLDTWGEDAFDNFAGV